MNKLAKYKLCADVKSSVSAKLLYLILIEMSDEQGKSAVSQRKIGEALGLSRDTVRRNIRRLKDSGLIEVLPQWNEDGGQSVNKIRIR